MTIVGNYMPMVTLFSSIFCPHKLPIAGNIGTKYLQKVSHGWEICKCPSGHLFVPDRCACLPAHISGNRNSHLYILRRKDSLKSKYPYPNSGKKILLFTGKSSNMNVYRKYPIPSERSYKNHISKTYNPRGLLASPTSGARKHFILRNRPNDLYTYQGINKLSKKSPNMKSNTRHVFIIMKNPPKDPDVHINLNNNYHFPSGSVQRHPILRNRTIQTTHKHLYNSLKDYMKNILQQPSLIKHPNDIDNHNAFNFSLQSENGHTFDTRKDMTFVRHGPFHINGKNEQIAFQRQGSSDSDSLSTQGNRDVKHYQQTNLGNRPGISLHLDTKFPVASRKTVLKQIPQQNTNLRNINNVIGQPTGLQRPQDNFSVNSMIRTLQELQNVKRQTTSRISLTNLFRESPITQRHPGGNSKKPLDNRIPFKMVHTGFDGLHPDNKDILPFANDLGVNNIGNIAIKQDNNIPFRMEDGLDRSHSNSKIKISFSNDIGLNNIGNTAIQQKDNNIPFGMETGLDRSHLNSKNKMLFLNDLGINNIGNIAVKHKNNRLPIRMDTRFDSSHSNSKNKISFTNNLSVNNTGNIDIQQQNNSILFGMETGFERSHRNNKSKIFSVNTQGVNNNGSIAIQQLDNNIPFRMETGLDGSGQNTIIPFQKPSSTSNNKANINNDTSYSPLPFGFHWDQNTPMQQGAINNFDKISFIDKTFPYFKENLQQQKNTHGDIGNILTPHSLTDNPDNSFQTDPGMSHINETSQSNVTSNSNGLSMSDPGRLMFFNAVQIPTLDNNGSGIMVKNIVPSNSVSKDGSVGNKLESIGKETTGLTLPFHPNFPSDRLPLPSFSPAMVQTSTKTNPEGQHLIDLESSGAIGGKGKGTLNSGSLKGLIRTQPDVKYKNLISQGKMETLKEVGNERKNLFQSLSPSDMDTVIQQLDKKAPKIESKVPSSNSNVHVVDLNNLNRNTFGNAMSKKTKPKIENGNNLSNDSFRPVRHSDKAPNFRDQTHEGIVLVEFVSGEGNNGFDPFIKGAGDINMRNSNYIPKQREISNDSSVQSENGIVKDNGFSGRKSVGNALVDKAKTSYTDSRGILNIDGFPVPVSKRNNQQLHSIKDQQNIGGSTDLSNIPTPDIQNSGQSPDIISQVKTFVKSKMLAVFNDIDQENDARQPSAMIQPDMVNIALLSGQGRFVTPTGKELPLMSEHSVVGGDLKRTELSPEICLGCTMDGGLGYTSHPERCDQFVVCYPEVGGAFRPIAQDCPYGQFWSKKDVTCRPSKNVRCNMDVCNKLETGNMYSHRTNCVSYWECQGGFSVPRCCAPGQGFTSAGCQPSNKCQDVCPDNGVFVWDVGCNKRLIPNTVSEFEKYTLPGGWKNSTCGEGAIFRREICDCVPVHKDTSTYNFDEKCRPEVFLPFDSDFRDYSGSNTFVRVINVTLTNGAACFNGSSVLAIPKFANMDLGSNVYIKIRYKQGDLSLETEALLYNGDCDERSSMVIGTKPSGNAFTIRTTTQEVQTIWVPSSVPANDWREVVMSVNGDRMEGSTNAYSTSTIISGGIARSTCGIKLGWGKGFPNFVGCIDEMILYRCNPGTVSGRTEKKT